MARIFLMCMDELIHKISKTEIRPPPSRNRNLTVYSIGSSSHIKGQVPAFADAIYRFQLPAGTRITSPSSAYFLVRRLSLAPRQNHLPGTETGFDRSIPPLSPASSLNPLRIRRPSFTLDVPLWSSAVHVRSRTASPFFSSAWPVHLGSTDPARGDPDHGRPPCFEILFSSSVFARSFSPPPPSCLLDQVRPVPPKNVLCMLAYSRFVGSSHWRPVFETSALPRHFDPPGLLSLPDIISFFPGRSRLC